MPRTARLKSNRRAEARKIALAVKYADRGAATGGGRVNPKKIRRKMEARFIPLLQRLSKPSRKQKRGRRHPPPSKATLQS